MDITPVPAVVPTQADVERISSLTDPASRNLQITQCYHELSAALQRRTGTGANWCTFATWASKQAGQSIRKEDLARGLEDRLQRSPEVDAALSHLARLLKSLGAGRSLEEIRAFTLRALDLSTTVERTSQAVSRGNQKVFSEIGREFARFFEFALVDEAPDIQKLALFSHELRPGPPPEGQEYLRQAFTHLYQALFEAQPALRAELMLCSNIEIGYHEQTRLQPEIQAAMEAPLVSGTELLRKLLSEFFPITSATWMFASTLIQRLLGRPPLLELAVRRLLAAAQVKTQNLLTEAMLSIGLPHGPLPLGRDLTGEYPLSLRQLTLPDLSTLLAQIDPTPNSLSASGAGNWADLPERLHFIIELFRLHHENVELCGPPFSPEQTRAIKEGGIPAGRL